MTKMVNLLQPIQLLMQNQINILDLNYNKLHSFFPQQPTNKDILNAVLAKWS